MIWLLLSWFFFLRCWNGSAEENNENTFNISISLSAWWGFIAQNIVNLSPLYYGDLIFQKQYHLHGSQHTDCILQVEKSERWTKLFSWIVLFRVNGCSHRFPKCIAVPPRIHETKIINLSNYVWLWSAILEWFSCSETGFSWAETHKL